MGETTAPPEGAIPPSTSRGLFGGSGFFFSQDSQLCRSAGVKVQCFAERAEFFAVECSGVSFQAGMRIRQAPSIAPQCSRDRAICDFFSCNGANYSVVALKSNAWTSEAYSAAWRSSTGARGSHEENDCRGAHQQIFDARRKFECSLDAAGDCRRRRALPRGRRIDPALPFPRRSRLAAADIRQERGDHPPCARSASPSAGRGHPWRLSPGRLEVRRIVPLPT